MTYAEKAGFPSGNFLGSMLLVFILDARLGLPEGSHSAPAEKDSELTEPPLTSQGTWTSRAPISV